MAARRLIVLFKYQSIVLFNGSVMLNSYPVNQSFIYLAITEETIHSCIQTFVSVNGCYVYLA
jgi:hypothetical protein